MTEDRILARLYLRLEAWAEWCTRGGLWGCYPSQSLEYRLFKGLERSAHPGLPLCPEHPEAEEIEGWVVDLHRQNPDLAQALRVQYFHAGSTRNKAQCLRISHTQFQLRLKMAEHWLAGRLSATLKRKK